MAAKQIIDLKVLIEGGSENDLHLGDYSLCDEIIAEIMREFCLAIADLEGDIRIGLEISFMEIFHGLNLLIEAYVVTYLAEKTGSQLIYNPVLFSHYYDFENDRPARLPNKKRHVPKLGEIRRRAQSSLFMFSRKAAYLQLNKLLMENHNTRYGHIGHAVRALHRSLIDNHQNCHGLSQITGTLRSIVLRTMTKFNMPLSRNFSSSIDGLITYYLNIALKGLNLITPSFLKSFRVLYTGTGGRLINRLVSYYFIREGKRVFRFTHGGDRAFYNDMIFDLIDLSFCDEYICHGRGEAREMADRFQKKLLPSLQESDVKFSAAGSKYHKTLKEEHEEEHEDKAGILAPGRTVLISQGAFNGPFCQYPYIKYNDIAYYDWLVYLIKLLKRENYKVILKRHPKGQFHTTRMFGTICDEEVLGGSISDHFQRVDAIILDYGCSVLWEAICTMKKVVFIDMGLRPFNPKPYMQLKECVSIVQASSHKGRYRLSSEEKFFDALEGKYSKKKLSDFADEYWIDDDKEKVFE